jgi:hypothetical protein
MITDHCAKEKKDVCMLEELKKSAVFFLVTVIG